MYDMNEEVDELENSIIENSDDIYSPMDIVLEHKKIIERDIWSLGFKLQERKELVEKINKYIQSECEHDFIIDFIDSIKNYDKGSQKIVYCSLVMQISKVNSDKC